MENENEVSYSNVQNNRGGTIINFSEIFPPPRPLFWTPRLFISRKHFYPFDNFSVVNHEMFWTSDLRGGKRTCRSISRYKMCLFNVKGLK